MLQNSPARAAGAANTVTSAIAAVRVAARIVVALEMMVAIWISVRFTWLRWPLFDPHSLRARVKRGKWCQRVARECDRRSVRLNRRALPLVRKRNNARHW